MTIDHSHDMPETLTRHTDTERSWLAIRLSRFPCAADYSGGFGHLDPVNRIVYLHDPLESEAFLADHPGLRVWTDDEVSGRASRVTLLPRLPLKVEREEKP